MANKTSFIDELFNNENLKVTITAAQSSKISSVVGYLDSDFSIGSSAEYTSPFKLKGEAEGVAEIVNIIGSSLGMGLVANNKAFTKLVWTGTANEPFQITFTVPALNSNSDVRKEHSTLLGMIQPSGNDYGVLTPPLNYAANSFKGKEIERPTGTLNLSIGTWFYATTLVLRTVSVSYSKETLVSGLPLYATYSLSLESAWLQDKKDTQRWLKGSGNSKSVSSLFTGSLGL